MNGPDQETSATPWNQPSAECPWWDRPTFPKCFGRWTSYSCPAKPEGQIFPEGIEVNLTCCACPEQYDVLYDGGPLGYLRLRGSRFSAHYAGPGDADCAARYLDPGAEVLAVAYDPEGSGLCGQFHSPADRAEHLDAAIRALILRRVAERR